MFAKMQDPHGQKQPLVRVTLSAHALITREDQLLMVRLAYQDHRQNKWAFPGGFVDEGENPEAALQREVCEEIGLQLREWRQVQVVPFLISDRPHVGFIYACAHWDGEPRILSHELCEIAWFTKQQFRNAVLEQTLAYPEMAQQVACLGWGTDDLVE